MSELDSRPDDLLRLAEQMRDLMQAGQVDAAESLLVAAADQRSGDPGVFNLLADFYLATQRPAQALATLRRCIEAAPADSDAYLKLAAAFESAARHDEVLAIYERLCAARPELPLAHFNRAVQLRRLGRPEDALAAYRRAIDAGLDHAADAWSNMGVILSDLNRHDEARAAFETALSLDPRWIPALYNLGLLHEEFGERLAAVELFQQVLVIDPDYDEALARLVHATPLTGRDEPLLTRVRARLARPELASETRESLLFALGKGLDDCGAYDDAFAAFVDANASARARFGAYDRAAGERDIEAICERFDATWLGQASPVSDQPLLFICGVWRSGTTLLERMLAPHPALTAGGELGYFNQGVDAAALAVDEVAATSLGRGYLELLRARFPGAGCVINKRPDNFRHLGLLAGLFPGARFIAMQRDPLDACLSVFAQQFGEQLPYATDLDDIVHFWLGYRRLLRHWQTLFPERILQLQYEHLVQAPERELRRVCEFLELPWEPRMLDFANHPGRVRTASLWQVREPLHTRSLNRAGHYASQLTGAARALAQSGELA